jgi:hypothetical protein
MQPTINTTPVMVQKTTSKNPVVSGINLISSILVLVFTTIYSLVYRTWTEQLSRAANTFGPIAQAMKTRKVSSVELAKVFNDVNTCFSQAASTVLSDNNALVIDQNMVIGGESVAIRAELSHQFRTFADQLSQLPASPIWAREYCLAAVAHLRMASTIITSDKSDEATRKAFAAALTGVSIAFANQARFLEQTETFYVNGQLPETMIAQYVSNDDEQPTEDFSNVGYNARSAK